MAKLKGKGVVIAGLVAGAISFFRKKDNRDKVMNYLNQAKQKVKSEYNWNKIAQDTYFTYEKAICKTVAEKQKEQIAQEKAKKEKKEGDITSLLNFKKRQAFA